MNKLSALFLSVLLSYLCMVNVSYADTVNAELSRDKIAMGETFTVSFTMNSYSGRSNPDFSPLEQDFQILSKNYATSINILNGAMATQTLWRLTLEPKKAGVIILPEITFGKDKSAARQIVVQDAPSQMVTDQQDSSAFVRAEVSTTTPYIQSQLIYTFKLFYQSQFENSRVEIPQIKDAKLVQLGDGSQYQTTINGRSYLVVEKKFALFPQKSGVISIPPAHFRALTYDTNNSMMNGGFYVEQPKSVSLATRPITLNVQNIPDKFQGKTWLPAKNLIINESWSVDPSQWEAGNPVTRAITVEANGLRADQIPDLVIDKISGVNIYVDPPKRSNNVQGDTVIGIVEQNVTYIPSYSQSFTIPGLKLNWWNTQTNTNAVAELNSLAVHAKGKINTTNPTPSNHVSIPAAIDASKSMLSRPVTTSDTSVKTTSFFSSIWFWAALFLFAGWSMTLWFIWGKRPAAKKCNLDTSSIKDKPSAEPSTELSDESFKQACEQGNAVLAQQFLLSWAKRHWPDSPLNLEKLCEMSADENFKRALINLEQAIYAKKASPWDGSVLLAAYQHVKKHSKSDLSMSVKTKNADVHQMEPLPPLNPY